MTAIRTVLVAAISSLAFPATADEVTESIDSAREAYEAGDIAYAAEELTFALQLLNEMKAGGLREFLPEPQDGWVREFDDDLVAGLGMMGGLGAAAEYSRGGEEFTISILADSPMLAGMAAMFANSAMLTASGAKLVRVGREKFIDQDGDLTSVVGGRILVQAEGEDRDAILSHLESMDFRALAGFGS